jgi:hypothetical protein
MSSSILNSLSQPLERRKFIILHAPGVAAWLMSQYPVKDTKPYVQSCLVIRTVMNQQRNRVHVQ